MTDSDETAGPIANVPADPQAEAQAAADGLKTQLAAVRARVRHARETLHAHARREQRSFRSRD